MYFGALFGYDAAERRRRAGRLLDQVGIGGERRLQLRKFSKGMLQRVGIAQALLNDPDLVIFDEPMSGLDPLGRRDVRALILGLRDRGCTVVLQLARAERRRGAVQPRRHPRARPARGERRAARDAGLRGQRMGAGRRRHPRRAQRRRRRAGIRRVVPIGEGRYALELPLDPPPERLLADLAASGAKLISLNPIRPTLEDLFVEQVTSPAAMARAAEAITGRLMKAIAAIAVNVFRESVRDKVLYNLVLFAILMMGASYLLGQLTAGQDVKIIKDLGLSATSVFGLFIAVFIGIGLVSKEVERRSVYSLLPKPIHRYQLVLGKYAGLTLTLVVNILDHDARLLRGAAVHARGASIRRFRRAWDAPALDPALLKAIGLILVELLLVTADRALLLDVLDADPVGRA